MNKDNRPHEQREFFEKDELEPRDPGPVTCLGMTFENDEKRREYFLERLREKLKNPAFRKIEGFPHWRGRGYSGFVRSAVLHRLFQIRLLRISSSTMGSRMISASHTIGSPLPWT